MKKAILILTSSLFSILLVAQTTSTNFEVTNCDGELYNLFDDLESARFVNSCLMLLSSLSKQSDCTIVVTGMAKNKDNNEWILSPGGKHIMKSPKSNIYFLKKIQNHLKIRKIDQ